MFKEEAAIGKARVSKKESIVFHSACGNNYLAPKKFYKEFMNRKRDVHMLRVSGKKGE